MEENKNKRNEPRDKKHEEQGFSSNPEKSFEAGKKGGTPSMRTSNQSSSEIKSPTTSGSSTSSGEHHSRVDKQNRPTQGEGWQSRRAGSEDAGKKSMPED